jgi:hypothetical protein
MATALDRSLKVLDERLAVLTSFPWGKEPGTMAKLLYNPTTDEIITSGAGGIKVLPRHQPLELHPSMEVHMLVSHCTACIQRVLCFGACTGVGLLRQRGGRQAAAEHGGGEEVRLSVTGATHRPVETRGRQGHSAH